MPPTARPIAIPTPPRMLPLLLLAIAAGCGTDDGLGRRAVSGEVALDGEPLARGTILLEPADGEAGTAVGTTIRAGRFALGRAEGPVPGRYRVRIYAADRVQEPPGPGESPGRARPMRERVPPAYNVDTTLEARVTPDGPNAYRFELATTPGSGPTGTTP